MLLNNSHSFAIMEKLASYEITLKLQEIKTIIEQRLNTALNEINTETLALPNSAIDNEYLQKRIKQKIYLSTIESIIDELQSLGHNLLPLDEDPDISFESSSVSWHFANTNGYSFGLDIEFLPHTTNVHWVVLPKDCPTYM